MSQGNRGEIGPVRPQAHGLNDVGGVRGQLRSRESDKPGRACRAGSGFEVDAVFRDAFDRGTGLSVIERTNKATVAPCAKNLENKFGAAAAGKDHRVLGRRRLGSLGQLLESPAAPGSEINQGELVGAGTDHFLPGGIQHCQITMGQLGWAQDHMTVISPARVFDFERDTFAFPNELVWEYHFDERAGRGWAQKRNPPPTYAHHCFPVVRSARQFYFAAHFDSLAPGVDEAEYRRRIRAVVKTDPRAGTPRQQITIPGYGSLREFSAAHPRWLKEECGGAWQSYAQRGNWRMIMPFSRRGQERMARQISGRAGAGRLPLAHVATFPSLTINHALLVFEASETKEFVEFQAYDPNICTQPLKLRFDRGKRWFEYPRTHYFPGGRVNVYEVYCGMCL